MHTPQRAVGMTGSCSYALLSLGEQNWGQGSLSLILMVVNRYGEKLDDYSCVAPIFLLIYLRIEFETSASLEVFMSIQRVSLAS